MESWGSWAWVIPPTGAGRWSCRHSQGGPRCSRAGRRYLWWPPETTASLSATAALRPTDLCCQVGPATVLDFVCCRVQSEERRRALVSRPRSAAHLVKRAREQSSREPWSTPPVKVIRMSFAVLALFQMMSLKKGQESAAEACELSCMHRGLRSICPSGVVPKDGWWRCSLHLLAQGLTKFGTSGRRKLVLAC